MNSPTHSSGPHSTCRSTPFAPGNEADDQERAERTAELVGNVDQAGRSARIVGASIVPLCSRGVPE
jgi:hypothetical protein